MHNFISCSFWIACLLVSLLPHARAAAAPAVQPPIVINEILAHTDPPQEDSIELFNPGATTVDVSNWILADNAAASPRYVIPADASIEPHSYRVITLTAADPFRLSEFGETLYLYQPGSGAEPGPLVDRAEFGVSPNGVSFGPITLSSGAVRQVLQQAVTLGDANTPPQIGPLVIDELMYRPAAGLAEYVALRNAGAAAAPLCDEVSPGQLLPAILRVNGDAVYTLPCGPLLAPGERLFIARATPAEFRAQYAPAAAAIVVGPFSGRLSNEGELVEIAWPQPPELDGSIAYYALDQVDYTAVTPWPEIPADGISLMRLALAAYGDDPTNWRTSADAPPTPRVWLPRVER